VRMKRVLRGLCSARLSGNSYLLVGALVAALAPIVPVTGMALAPIIAAVGVVIGAGLIATIVAALLGSVVL